MSRGWTNQESNFFRQGNLQGRQTYCNENNQKFNTKAYLNPQVVNCEFVKRSLCKSYMQGTNKILVNPNFRSDKLNNPTNKNYSHLINTIHSNSQNKLFCEPGTSNTLSVSEQKKSVNSSLFDKHKNSSSTKAIPHQSRFKKVNAISLKSSSKSLYSWSKNKTKELDLNSYSVNQTEDLTVKSVGEKIKNLNYNKNAYKYTSPKVTVDQACKNMRNRLIYKSKTKIINDSVTRLINDTSRAKLNEREKTLDTALKRHLNFSKFACDNNKKSSVLKVAKAVRSKYRYLSNSEQYKKSKYKIDKRKKLLENVKKKSNSKDIKDIRKLFPNYLYNKIKPPSYNIYNLGLCRNILESKSLLRDHQPIDEVNKNINQFQNKRVVKIGGILYKSTTTKLTLASRKGEISSKKTVSNKSKAKKNCVVYVRGKKFILENNGRALRREPGKIINDKTPLLTPKRIDIGGVTYLRKSNNVLIRTNVHQARHFVNKARNKSIALLANLRKRSTMPCMIYHSFGRCNRDIKGLCMYKHDPKNIAVCKKFLKGDCSGNNCLLSHQVIQEKMATCHFFLKGLCVKDNCPFLHVKLSKNAAICEHFLQGFCTLGKECSKRHLHLCPQFDKYGTCKLGSKCPYPHKKLETEGLPGQKGIGNLCKNQVRTKNENAIVQYYLHPEIQKKQKKIKQSSIKLKEAACTKTQKPTVRKGLSLNGFDQSEDVIKCFPKRIKLEKLPCFIPLNSES